MTFQNRYIFWYYYFVAPVLVPCRNPMTDLRFFPGSIPRRSVLIVIAFSCPLLSLPAHYCLCLPTIISVLFLTYLWDCPLTATAFYRSHCSYFLSLCALFWGASSGRGIGSNFGAQLWGTIVGSNFAALQQHW
jgi:hypothetical protein